MKLTEGNTKSNKKSLRGSSRKPIKSPDGPKSKFSIVSYMREVLPSSTFKKYKKLFVKLDKARGIIKKSGVDIRKYLD